MMPTEDALAAMQALADETGLDLSDEGLAAGQPQVPDHSPGQVPDHGPGQVPDGPGDAAPPAGPRSAQSEAGQAGAPQQPQALHQVPLAAYLSEMAEKQELRRRLEAFESARRPAPEPDPFLDPKAFVTANAAALLDARLDQHVSPVLRQLQVAIAHNNKATAAAVHGPDLVERAQAEFDGALPRMDPGESVRVLRAPNPFLAAIDWLRRKEVLAEVGGDPKAYRERILEEALADPEFLGRAVEAARPLAGGRREEPQQGARAQAQRAALLPSLNRFGSSSGATALRREETDQDLIDWATSRKSARPE